MEISVGPLPVAVRTKSSAALTGVPPRNSGKLYIPAWHEEMFRYSDPDNYDNDEVDEGGAIDFADDHILRIDEIRSFLPTGKVLEVQVVDKIQEMTFVFGAPPAAPDFTTLGIQRNDILTVVSGTSPNFVTETYRITRVLGALVLEVDGIIVDRNLVADNSVRITDAEGKAVRYAVDLTGADTVDFTGDALAVHIVDPATAGDDVRIAFSEPPVVLSNQFVKIVTDAGGVVDVYVVKASVI